jgi:ketosteroid isomerase-like protein
MTEQLQALATGYVEAVGRNDYDALSGLFDPDVEFHGPYVTLRGAGEYLTALRRLAAVRLRHDVRKVFADGNDVCVIYDFVTDTAAGAVPFVEWLTFDRGRLRAIRLYFDREQFAPAREALMRRARGEAP